MDDEDTGEGEVLDLADFPEDQDEQDDQAGEVVIAFAEDGEEAESDTPLIRQMRAQLRERDRQLAQYRRSPPAGENDPEPVVPDRPRALSDFDFDEDRFNAALDEHIAAKETHAEWQRRQSERDSARQRAQDEQTRKIEQQIRALRVADYADKSALVRDRLSDGQMAVLINAADDPARLIYALAGSETRLGMLAGIDNLAKFAARVGNLEKEIKMPKRTVPAPETRVRGATASLAVGGDKTLQRLEAEAAKSGDRTAVQRYKRQQKQQAA